MTDFRTVERDLIEFFEAAGVQVMRAEGDAFAVVGSINCEHPRTCQATFALGVIVCPCLAGSADIAEPECVAGEASILSLTKLAERLAGR